jgi:Uri superfamily endonuclease
MMYIIELDEQARVKNCFKNWDSMHWHILFLRKIKDIIVEQKYKFLNDDIYEKEVSFGNSF